MRGIILFVLSTCVHSCWIYSKNDAIDRVWEMISRDGKDSIDREYLRVKMTSIPGPMRWTVEQFGVDRVFSDCDTDNDGIINMEEARLSATCLDTCMKLGAVNMFSRL